MHIAKFLIAGPKTFAALAGVLSQVLEFLVLLLEQSSGLFHQRIGRFDFRVLFAQFRFRRFDLALAAFDPLPQLRAMFFVELDSVTMRCDLIFELLHLGPRVSDLFVCGVEFATRRRHLRFALVNLVACCLFRVRYARDLGGAFVEFLLEALQFAM